MRLALLTLIALAGCATTSPATRTAAQPAADPFDAPDALHRDFTDEQLIALLTDLGYEARPVIDGSITFELGPAQVMLFNQWDGDLQLYYVVTGGRWTLENINEWNRTRRLCRAYIDPDGDLVLESDLLALGGVTNRQVVSFVAIFDKAVEMFIHEVASDGVRRRLEQAPPPEEPGDGTWH